MIIFFRLIILILISACGKESTEISQIKLDLKFSGKEFTPHNEQNLHAMLSEAESKKMLKKDVTTIKNGEFLFSWQDLLEKNRLYYLSYYTDMNNNGKCDNPPIDHVWQVKVRSNEDIIFEDTHNMNFANVCQTLNEEPTPVQESVELLITGRLLVGENVPQENNLSIGSALADSTVFLENFPNQEATTDKNGGFSLKLNIPKALTLASNQNIVMWHTVKKNNSSVNAWDKDQLRLGLRKELIVATDNLTINLGDIELKFTTRVNMIIQNSESGERLNLCWLHNTAYDFQSIFVNKGNGSYILDYLPKGNYSIKIHCDGYVDKSIDVNVEQANSLNASQDLGVVEMTPDSI